MFIAIESGVRLCERSSQRQRDSPSAFDSCACIGMAAQAVAFVRRATSAPERRPFFLYFAGTVPHTPFSLPASFEVNVTRTPAGPVAFEPEWQARRQAVLRRLVNEGLVCKDYRQCHGRGGKALPDGGTDAASYEGAANRLTSMAYKRPIAVTDPWLEASWLYTEPNFEQARLARLFVSGLAWLDDSIGTVLDSLEATGVAANTIVVYSADHGASYLGKGHIFEAGVRVPLIVRWPSTIAKGTRTTAPAALLDLAPTLLAAAGADSDESVSLHGESLLPTLRAGAGAAAAAGERPVFIEIGYGRAVVRGPWKLLVINDAIDRCRPPKDGVCRNLHGELIDRYACNFTANGHMANPGQRLGCNMTYDAVARHSGFCDRRQVHPLLSSPTIAHTHLCPESCTRTCPPPPSGRLTAPPSLVAARKLYHTGNDPLEQSNVAAAHPELYDELLALIRAHALRVEPSNPAIVNSCERGDRQCLRHCDRLGGGGGGGGSGGGGGGGGFRRQQQRG